MMHGHTNIKVIIFLYIINRLALLTEMLCVLCKETSELLYTPIAHANIQMKVLRSVPELGIW